MGWVFKTAWFSKTARKANISDQELCAAIEQVQLGQVVDLGGGVLKKRLNKNRHRAIILVKIDELFFYEYVFAKKDRDNIGENELSGFRMLAKCYAKIQST